MSRPSDARIVLVLGGARSGKSRHAESLVEQTGLAPIYVATAHAGDGEMVERIANHRARRGPQWRTIEAPLDLPATIRAHAGAERALLVDCITLWISNLLMAGADPGTETGGLLDALSAAAGTVVIVSNEVGQGIVPDNALARQFRDAAGLANQRIAGLAEDVVLVSAGLPLVLKRRGDVNGA